MTVAGVTREIINPYLLCINNIEQCHHVLWHHVCSKAVQCYTWYHAHCIPDPVDLPMRSRLDPVVTSVNCFIGVNSDLNHLSQYTSSSSPPL